MKKLILLGFVMSMLVLMQASMISCTKLDSEEVELINRSEVLMKDSPDSSLALLKSISLSDLYSKPAKAKYALLYTKAQHKSYETIPNDSLINIAVEYYMKKDGDQDYAEALMYRGAALYDMMDYKEALNSYKLAEDILRDGEDYEMLALINSRMGDLHIKRFSDVTKAIERDKTAAAYYNQLGNIKNEGRSYHSIGSRYILIPDKDSALFYLQKSLDIAKEIDDMGVVNNNKYLLMLLHNNFSEYEDAIKIGVSTINQIDKVPRDIIHELCKGYAMTGKIDSARMYFDKYFSREDMGMANYETLSIIEENAKNYKDALMHHKEVRQVADSIFNKGRESEIVMAEKRFDYQKVLADSMIIKERHKTQVFIGLFLITVFLIIIYTIIRRRKRDTADKESFIEHLRADSEAANNSFLEKLSQKDVTESRLKEIIEKRITALSQLMDISYRYGTNESIFLREYKNIMNMDKLGKDVLIDISDLVNIKSGGIIDYISKEHPSLTKDDLSFIALVYSKFSPTAICSLFSYSKPDSVYVRKNRITNKMGIKVQLDSYLNGVVFDENGALVQSSDS